MARAKVNKKSRRPAVKGRGKSTPKASKRGGKTLAKAGGVKAAAGGRRGDG